MTYVTNTENGERICFPTSDKCQLHLKNRGKRDSYVCRKPTEIGQSSCDKYWKTQVSNDELHMHTENIEPMSSVKMRPCYSSGRSSE